MSFLNRFDIEIEPLFACIALYDIKERKKVSVHTVFSWSLLGFSLSGLIIQENLQNLCNFFTDAV